MRFALGRHFQFQWLLSGKAPERHCNDRYPSGKMPLNSIDQIEAICGHKQMRLPEISSKSCLAELLKHINSQAEGQAALYRCWLYFAKTNGNGFFPIFGFFVRLMEIEEALPLIAAKHAYKPVRVDACVGSG